MPIALYMRCTMAESDTSSITAQKKILKEYLEKNEALKKIPVKEYIDEGYPGSGFARPAFQSLISDARHRQIDIILVTDFTRIGTDFSEVREYIENVFPFLGVRVLSLADHYDSRQYELEGAVSGEETDKENTAILNKKETQNHSNAGDTLHRNKVQTKTNHNSRPPFGYKINSQTGSWLIDQPSATWVRDIFSLATIGCTTTEISDYLNENHVLTPGKYKRENGSAATRQRQVVPDEEALWDCAKVRTILCRQEYTGVHISGRRKTLKTGSRITRKAKESEFIIEEKHHPALVTEAVFEKAQSVVRKRKKDAYRIQRDFLLKGKVRCGNCKSALGYLNSGSSPKLYCPHKKITGSYSGCPDMFYEEADLEKLVCKKLAARKGQTTECFMESYLTEKMIQQYIDCVYVYSATNIEVIWKEKPEDTR